MSAGAVPIDITANLNDVLNNSFNNLGASTSSASIGSYRSGNVGQGSSSGLGLFKGTLIFLGVYLVLKLLKKGGK